MNPVFLDTVGILALLERSDQWVLPFLSARPVE